MPKSISVSRLALLFLLLFGLFGCNNSQKPAQTSEQNSGRPDRDTLLKKIQFLEQKISTEQAIDYKSGAEMVSAYLAFFNYYSKDAFSADYLFKAADITMNLKQSSKAIELFRKVVEFYPDYKKSSFALFLQGFVYENQLKDFKEAKKIYEEVIRKYPHTKLADDASASIANLGKSDEELIKEFEKKNKVN